MKIIRDKLAEEIGKNEGWDRVSKVPSTVGKAFLYKKVLEEAQEVVDARLSKEELVAEMGDLMEVLYELMDRNGISIEGIQKAREAKAKVRGLFKKNYVLVEGK